jgi:hypothetical protein
VLSGLLAHLVDGDDVGMVQPGGGASLLLEAPDEQMVLRHVGVQHLERDDAVEGGVVGLVHHGEAAAPDLVEDLVLADAPGLCYRFVL